MNIHSVVLDRYLRGAMDVQPSLCCPVSYDNSLLTLLREEIVSNENGCC